MSPGPHVRGEDGSAAQGSQERGPGRGRGGVSQGRRAEGGPRVALAGLRPGTGPARPPAHAQSPPRAATPACQVVSAQTTHAPHLAQVAGVGEGRRGFVAAAGMMRTDRFHNDRCHAPDRVHSLLRVPHFPAGLTESTRINPLSHVRLRPRRPRSWRGRARGRHVPPASARRRCWRVPRVQPPLDLGSGPCQLSALLYILQPGAIH